MPIYIIQFYYAFIPMIYRDNEKVLYYIFLKVQVLDNLLF